MTPRQKGFRGEYISRGKESAEDRSRGWEVKGMKNIAGFLAAAVLHGMTPSSASAHSGILESGGCCWIFILFGVLIVIAQLVPAALLIIGFVKGFPIKHPDVPEKAEKAGG